MKITISTFVFNFIYLIYLSLAHSSKALFEEEFTPIDHFKEKCYLFSSFLCVNNLEVTCKKKDIDFVKRKKTDNYSLKNIKLESFTNEQLVKQTLEKEKIKNSSCSWNEEENNSIWNLIAQWNCNNFLNYFIPRKIIEGITQFWKTKKWNYIFRSFYETYFNRMNSKENGKLQNAYREINKNADQEGLRNIHNSKNFFIEENINNKLDKDRNINVGGYYFIIGEEEDSEITHEIELEEQYEKNLNRCKFFGICYSTLHKKDKGENILKKNKSFHFYKSYYFKKRRSLIVNKKNGEKKNSFEKQRTENIYPLEEIIISINNKYYCSDIPKKQITSKYLTSQLHDYAKSLFLFPNHLFSRENVFQKMFNLINIEEINDAYRRFLGQICGNNYDYNWKSKIWQLNNDDTEEVDFNCAIHESERADNWVNTTYKKYCDYAGNTYQYLCQTKILKVFDFLNILNNFSETTLPFFSLYKKGFMHDVQKYLMEGINLSAYIEKITPEIYNCKKYKQLQWALIIFFIPAWLIINVVYIILVQKLWRQMLNPLHRLLMFPSIIRLAFYIILLAFCIQCPYVNSNCVEYTLMCYMALNTMFNTIFHGNLLLISKGYMITRNNFDKKESIAMTLLISSIYVLTSINQVDMHNTIPVIIGLYILLLLILVYNILSVRKFLKLRLLFVRDAGIYAWEESVSVKLHMYDTYLNVVVLFFTCEIILHTLNMFYKSMVAGLILVEYTLEMLTWISVLYIFRYRKDVLYFSLLYDTHIFHVLPLFVANSNVRNMKEAITNSENIVQEKCDFDKNVNIFLKSKKMDTPVLFINNFEYDGQDICSCFALGVPIPVDYAKKTKSLSKRFVTRLCTFINDFCNTGNLIIENSARNDLEIER